MQRIVMNTVAVTAILAWFPSTGIAQGGHNVKLHVNPRWSECSFQLDPSLTQQAWRQFTKEAGLVGYFRPLTDAKPMGAGNWEVSVLQWETGIDDTDAAWNDTFVHPDSTHWLFDGPIFKFPGLMVRRGVTNRVDLGAYFTQNPNANYGFYGGQVQYNIVQDSKADWAASARLSFVSLFGPSDLDFSVHSLDVVVSKTYAGRLASVSPYAGVSSYRSTAHEKTAAVSLADEKVLSAQMMVGAVAQISLARIGVEYGTAGLRSRSFKMGVGF